MIITLCSSARFERWFHAWTEALGLSGHAAFGLCAYPSLHDGDKDWYTPEQKLTLDAVHRAKIAASDAVLVLNPFAYLGESTLAELRHAEALRKRVFVLESWGRGNGITSAHNSVVRAAAAALGVPAGYGSPVDTTGYTNVCTTELLGRGGAARSAVVGRLQAFGAV